jgi:hypothetical protein
VVLERDPVLLKVANSWLILNVGGGPTDDKPTVTLTTRLDPNRTSAFLNVRVADIARVYEEWLAKGAEFLTEPKDHGREIRAYVRDPDGHLIEVGQSRRSHRSLSAGGSHPSSPVSRPARREVELATQTTKHKVSPCEEVVRKSEGNAAYLIQPDQGKETSSR